MGLARKHAGGPGLIVMPLGVRQEFMRDAAMVDQKPRFIRRIEEVEDPDCTYLTNYETIRDSKLDTSGFAPLEIPSHTRISLKRP